jgi:Stress responsive A/B Barrel Domain
MPLENIFIHHVYFWLKNPGSDSDLAELKRGLKKLSAAKIIRQFHIGRPADTDRDVIDHSYSLSWLLIFENAADQAAYQIDPMHLQFVEECSHLWRKVIVYDTVDA